MIAQHFHCSRDTIENRFRYELDEDRSDGQVRIRGKLFQAAMNGSQRAVEVCEVNLCGWSLNKPEVSVTTNVTRRVPVSGPFFLFPVCDDSAQFLTGWRSLSARIRTGAKGERISERDVG